LDLSLVGDVRNEYLTPGDLLKRLGIAVPTNPQSKDCGAVLRETCGEPKRVQSRDKWRVPLRRPELLAKTFTGPKPPPEEDEF
jgi:hypothetical protein